MIICLFLTIVGIFHQSDEKYRDWAQQQNIPREVRDVMHQTGLDSVYSITFHVNPFYLRGDFNGDKVSDFAVLVKRKLTQKFGILIVHGNIGTVFVCGAGNRVPHLGEDFAWMNAWSVYAKGVVEQGAVDAPPPSLRGDALLVEKLEASSGLIYWTGKTYTWYQQGD